MTRRSAAASTLTTVHDEVPTAGPFLRWVGSKRKLAPELAALAPETFGHYHEPFVGSGCLFWNLAAAGRLKKNYVSLSDMCGPLVRTWRAIKNDVDDLLTKLACYPVTEKHFMKVRGLDPAELEAVDDAEVGAWFIYLNKTCFNGVWRVHSKTGRYNVPWGQWEKYKRTPLVVDEPRLRACSAVLSELRVSATHRSFETVLNYAEPGDFVYMDPPYLPKSATSSFTSYTPGGFNYEQQRQLRDVARALKERGVHIMVSNSDVPLVRELYDSWRGFRIDEVSAPRAVNSKATGRGLVREVVIR